VFAGGGGLSTTPGYGSEDGNLNGGLSGQRRRDGQGDARRRREPDGLDGLAPAPGLPGFHAGGDGQSMEVVA
jgi:hypothetical protein